MSCKKITFVKISLQVGIVMIFFLIANSGPLCSGLITHASVAAFLESSISICSLESTDDWTIFIGHEIGWIDSVSSSKH